MTETAIVPVKRVINLLMDGELEAKGLLPWSSNYTFLVFVRDQELSAAAVYKPCAGERPLWDFDRASLCKREVAAYLLSTHLGWPDVPPTVLRDGPHGTGSLQLYIDADHEEHYFSLRETGRYDSIWQRIALFDAVTNNADRKAGHCLLGRDGRIWAIDHGLTFHEEPKLRTVIWDYAGRRIPTDLHRGLCALKSELELDRPFCQELELLINRRELIALQARLDRLAQSARFPRPGARADVPYPLV